MEPCVESLPRHALKGEGQAATCPQKQKNNKVDYLSQNVSKHPASRQTHCVEIRTQYKTKHKQKTNKEKRNLTATQTPPRKKKKHLARASVRVRVRVRVRVHVHVRVRGCAVGDNDPALVCLRAGELQSPPTTFQPDPNPVFLSGEPR